MVAAQATFDVEHAAAADDRARHEYDYSPPQSAVSPALAERLSRELSAAAGRLLARCQKEGLIDVGKADDLRVAMAADAVV